MDARFPLTPALSPKIIFVAVVCLGRGEGELLLRLWI